ncbi:hypothetical protein DLAC_06299 [Tieghemostelium lacteum]|uniref:Transmembrane protein n=1 Tax=Tieghemostelium lacteum TaxID=361077 RepID=A0A151ZEF1_TIELA|nr:hypothetical protein DLAC_06299 [Tieghemostelium lacteum]|eukprot:KYQ92336.1 hypothetical protein DLAC_06299 [Tieghemostelium lacteum]
MEIVKIIIAFLLFNSICFGDYVQQYMYQSVNFTSDCTSDIINWYNIQTGQCTVDNTIYECDYDNQVVIQKLFSEGNCKNLYDTEQFQFNECIQTGVHFNCTEKFTLVPNTFTNITLNPNCNDSSDILVASSQFLGVCQESYPLNFGKYWYWETCNDTHLTVQSYVDVKQPISSGSGGILGSSGASGDSGSATGSSITGQLTSGSASSSTVEYWTPECQPQYLVSTKELELTNPFCSSNPSQTFLVCS